MNEINETFTKQINGFECTFEIGVNINNLFTEQKINITTDVFFDICKNGKCIVIFDENDDFRVHGRWWDKKSMSGERINYSKEEIENLHSKINYDNVLQIPDTNIWQILQDEWHKRFDV